MKACPGLKESTRVVKRNIYDSYIKISLGNIKISDIRYNHLLSYLQELLYSSNLSSGTVHSTFQLLSLLYDNAIRNKIIRDNLPRLILSDLQSQHPNMWAYQPREALTRDEQNAFISFCRTSRKRNVQRMRPLVTLLLGTGCG